MHGLLIHLAENKELFATENLLHPPTQLYEASDSQTKMPLMETFDEKRKIDGTSGRMSRGR